MNRQGLATLAISMVVWWSSSSLTAGVEAATLQVSSFPSGAQVSVDGLATGKVTPMTIALPEGDHSVTVSIPGLGWTAVTHIVTVLPGSNTLSVTLTPLSAARADGPCFDNVNRFVDCGNGTVTDTVTGIIWLKNVNCFGDLDWSSANAAAAALTTGECGLTDKSSAGDWRLPTRDELSATIAQALILGCRAPTFTNDAGTACYGDGSTSSFEGTGWQPGVITVEKLFFWSSSSLAGFPDRAHALSVANGNLTAISPVTGCACKGFTGQFFRTWAVRGGHR